jgi:hypothetical protein
MQSECGRMPRPVCACDPKIVYIRSRQCGTKMPRLRAVEPCFKAKIPVRTRPIIRDCENNRVTDSQCS